MRDFRNILGRSSFGHADRGNSAFIRPKGQRPDEGARLAKGAPMLGREEPEVATWARTKHFSNTFDAAQELFF